MLTLLSVIPPDGKVRKRTNGLFLCDCGKQTTTDLSRAKLGRVKSCGCLFASKKKHGLSHTRFQKIWLGIRERCHKNYRYKTKSKVQKTQMKRYRNLGMDERWLSFKNFISDMYESYLLHVKEYGEKNTSIDRIDNLLGYSKDNCRWATIKEQQRNRSNNRYLSVNGKLMLRQEVIEKYRLKASTFDTRISRGWSVEEAIVVPKNVHKKFFHPTKEMLDKLK